MSKVIPEGFDFTYDPSNASCRGLIKDATERSRRIFEVSDGENVINFEANFVLSNLTPAMGEEIAAKFIRVKILGS